MGDRGGVGRRALLIGGAAALGAGWAAIRLSDPGPEPLSGPVAIAPRRLQWSDLRPKTSQAAALRARIDARRRGELGLPAASTGPMAWPGPAGVRTHESAVASDWVDGGALNTGVSADGPFSWDSGRPAQAEDLVAALDGALVALPGYAVPLELGADGARSFLLAPFVGACIHVPPPPANQIVLVRSPAPYRFEHVFEAIVVTGEMRAAPTRSRLAEVGYQLQARRIEPFDPQADGEAWAQSR